MSEPALKLISLSDPMPILIVDPARVNIDDLLYAKPGSVVLGDPEAIRIIRPVRLEAPVGIDDPTLLTVLMAAYEL